MSEPDDDFQFEGILKDIEKNLINIIVDVAGDKSPLSPKLMEVLGYLLLHGELTQAQMAELTGFSIGTISSHLNQMVGLKIVQKELIPITRTYKYKFLGGGGSIEMQAGHMKLEVIQSSVNFFEQKLKEIETLKNEIGFDMLQERIVSLLKYFKWHQEAIIVKYKKFGVIK